MDPADLIEDNKESLVLMWEWFIMSGEGLKIPKEELDCIERFVSWCCVEYDKDLDIPRNPDGLSFRQRRDNDRETSNISS